MLGIVFVELLVNYWHVWFTNAGLELHAFPHWQNGESFQFLTFPNFYLSTSHLASSSFQFSVTPQGHRSFELSLFI